MLGVVASSKTTVSSLQARFQACHFCFPWHMATEAVLVSFCVLTTTATLPRCSFHFPKTNLGPGPSKTVTPLICVHERHVRECCLRLITSRTAAFQLPINKKDPAGFRRLCRGHCGSPVSPGSSCTSPWALRGLSSDPLILWYYVKMEGELIGKPWLLNDTTGGLVALHLLCVCVCGEC